MCLSVRTVIIAQLVVIRGPALVVVVVVVVDAVASESRGYLARQF